MGCHRVQSAAAAGYGSFVEGLYGYPVGSAVERPNTSGVSTAGDSGLLKSQLNTVRRIDSSTKSAKAGGYVSREAVRAGQTTACHLSDASSVNH